MANNEKEQNMQEEVMQEAVEQAQTQEAEEKQCKEAASEIKDKESDSSEDKKSFFDKKKDKKADLMKEKLAELEEQRVRQLAEFENFRKRSEKEKSQMFEMGAKSVIEQMLPVIDNFERGFMAVPEEEKEAPFVQGMEMVYKQMITVLEGIGVKAIEAVGKEFDPNLHNAVMMVDHDTLESGVVAEEMQKGYLYKETVVRHSMVKVVN